jgi:alcohol dehydrogenase class IV
MVSDRPFRFAYDPPVLRHGAGSVGGLGTELGRLGHDRALVVCGRTVGSRSAVVDPVQEGLGDRLAGVFAETTPAKRLETAIACARRAERLDADVLVGFGGASSLDLARVASALAATDRSPATLGEQLAATATLPVPEETMPVAVVPTTLAGGSLSMLAGVSADPSSGLAEEPVDGGVGDPLLMPGLALFDPELVATTPRDVLVGSAMNGFSKGVETLYASTRTPVTDATATEGLDLLSTALAAIGTDTPTVGDLDTALRGLALVQYGVSRPSGTTFSLLHALGHALRIHTDVQLGVAHAVVAPEALGWLFERVDGRRERLAGALGVEADTPAAGVVETVRELRDGLGLPRRLRELDGLDRSMLDGIAGMAANGFVRSVDAPNSAATDTEPRATAQGWSGAPHTPPALDISPAAVRGVLESAW